MPYGLAPDIDLDFKLDQVMGYLVAGEAIKAARLIEEIKRVGVKSARQRQRLAAAELLFSL